MICPLGGRKPGQKEGTYTFIFSKVGKNINAETFFEQLNMKIEPLLKKEMGNLTCWFVLGSLP
jgi:hypothetical protein